MSDLLRDYWPVWIVMFGPIVPAIVMGILAAPRPNPDLVQVQESKPKAPWKKRAFAWLIDQHIQMPFLVLAFIGTKLAGDRCGTSGTVIAAIVLYTIWYGVGFSNRCIRMGRRGFSFGRQFLGIKTVSEVSGEPIGIRRAFMREQFHYLDNLLVFGWFLPLRGDRGQTIADRLASTITFEEEGLSRRAVGVRKSA